MNRSSSARVAANFLWLAMILTAGSCANVTARDFWVSPQGNARGTGEFKNPWDLQTALDQAKPVKAGDTIWVREGVYCGAFTSNLNGTASAPIIVRNYAGERATIDRAGVDASGKAALTVNGSFVWFWGLEVTNSDLNRSRTSPFTGTVKAWRGPGVFVRHGTGLKFINLIIHDNNTGIYDKEDGTETYGCLIYFNGNNAFGHGMYIGNESGTKSVKDCLIFDNAGLGIQSYSANPTSQQKDIHIEGNAVFNNGAITLDDQNSTNILVGAEAGVSAERITITNNYIYAGGSVAANKSKGLRLGQTDQNNKDAAVIDNYIACGVPLSVLWWHSVELRGNTIYTNGRSAVLQVASGVQPSVYQWNNNVYISGRLQGPMFTYNGNTELNSSAWQQTGLDKNSQMIQKGFRRPTGVKVFVRPNAYESGRGNIVVFNWDQKRFVSVDVSSVGLREGEPFEIRDAQNYFAPPIISSTYESRPILLPMNLSRISEPVGNVERKPVHTAPEFAAFIIRRSERRKK
jgi:parallel beta helix pectate lyase-like protein